MARTLAQLPAIFSVVEAGLGFSPEIGRELYDK